MDTELSAHDRRAICVAFAAGLPYGSCRNKGEVIWRDASNRPNVFQPDLYKHRHAKTHRWCPDFVRLYVNCTEPWRFRRGFWEETEPLDPSGPNHRIEITVLPEEARALASWLPRWLVFREGLPIDVPDPPRGMSALLLWTPDRRRVYFWSESADKIYEDWFTRERGEASCRTF